MSATTPLGMSGGNGESPPTVARKRHINWALKAVLPIAAVLLNGLLLFLLVSSSLAPGPRNNVIAVAAGGAFVICVAVIMVLAVQVRRPMLELQEKFSRVQSGDMDVAVSFADLIVAVGKADGHVHVTRLHAGEFLLQLQHGTTHLHRQHHNHRYADYECSTGSDRNYVIARSGCQRRRDQQKQQQPIEQYGRDRQHGLERPVDVSFADNGGWTLAIAAARPEWSDCTHGVTNGITSSKFQAEEIRSRLVGPTGDPAPYSSARAVLRRMRVSREADTLRRGK